MDRKAVLAAIEQCVCHDREDAYGSPEDNFSRIAVLANVVLESKLRFSLTPLDVALFLACVKLGRLAHKPTLDSLVDLAGYAVCGAGMLHEDEEAPVGVDDR